MMLMQDLKDIHAKEGRYMSLDRKEPVYVKGCTPTTLSGYLIFKESGRKKGYNVSKDGVYAVSDGALSYILTKDPEIIERLEYAGYKKDKKLHVMDIEELSRERQEEWKKVKAEGEKNAQRISDVERINKSGILKELNKPSKQREELLKQESQKKKAVEEAKPTQHHDFYIHRERRA